MIGQRWSLARVAEDDRGKKIAGPGKIRELPRNTRASRDQEKSENCRGTREPREQHENRCELSEILASLCENLFKQSENWPVKHENRSDKHENWSGNPSCLREPRPENQNPRTKTQEPKPENQNSDLKMKNNDEQQQKLRFSSFFFQKHFDLATKTKILKIKPIQKHHKQLDILITHIFPRTPKPLTFSKNRLREAKNHSNTSPVAKKKSEKTAFFISKTLHMCKKKLHMCTFFCFVSKTLKYLKFFYWSLYNTYLKGFIPLGPVTGHHSSSIYCHFWLIHIAITGSFLIAITGSFHIAITG
ncbi:hypothetical protein LXL04_013613 [Taraxacum kok-saghyz]